MKKRILVRKLHYWLVPVIAMPFLVVIVSGLLLQVKKQVEWVQPKTVKGSQPGALTLDWSQALNSLQAHPELEVKSWKDIKRLDVRPSKGMAKVQLADNIEVQLDMNSGKVLQIAERNSDWLEALHDGSWFADWAKLWVFLPSGILVGLLWLTGVWLFIQPYYLKWRRTHHS